MLSIRLPGKVLMQLGGKTVLEHVIARAGASKLASMLIVATSTRKNDEKIVDQCERIGVRVFCGSENDVLDRFYNATKPLNPKHIVRITADCPLIDPAIIDRVIAEHIKRGADYTSNTIIPTYPDGEDVEVFKLSALESAWRDARLPSEREHVTPFIKKNPERFKLVNVSHKIDLSDGRWTLDEKDDYLFLEEIFNNLYDGKSIFGMNDVLEFLRDKAHLECMNNHINRDEGYKRSLKKDKTTVSYPKNAKR